MPLPRVHEDIASIVLLGNFNPAIFQPAWLAAKNLVRESEAESAVIEVVHPQLAQYRLEWMHLSVQRDRFVVMTSDPAHRVSLRDLVIGIFGLLEQTPTTKLGINRTMHVDMKDSESFHALGHLLAPKAPWNGILDNPGMRSLLMESPRSDGPQGKINVTVEPSRTYQRAAFFEVNYEYHVEPDSAQDPTAYFMKCISNDWDRVLDAAIKSIERLVDQVIGRT